MGRLPGLDGLRAFAVLAVFFFHYEQPHVTGGLLGVQIFFVLSGWLITGILAREFERSRAIDYAGFMYRRVLRLVPALIVLVIGSIIATVIIGTTSGLGWWVAGTLFYVNNVLIPLGHSGPDTAPTWSLAVEMQFYLLWPLVLSWLLIHRREGAGIILAIAAVIMLIVSAGLAAWLPLRWLYFPGLGGVCGLLAGSALALRPIRVATPIGAGAFVVLVAACLLAPDWTHQSFWSGWMQLATVGSILVVAWLSQTSNTPFAWPPVVWIGQRSYGIYLYHTAVRVVIAAIVTLSASELTVVGLVVTLVIAALSFRLIEAPFLARKARRAPAAAVVAS